MSRRFGTVCQNGYVVRDIEAAMVHWTEVLGVGPFLYVEEAPIQDFHYHGVPSAAKVGIAIAVTGPIQIELIALRDEEPSMWKDFLDAGHEGMQHMSYWTENFDADVARIEADGLVVGQSGWVGSEEGRFVYFESEGRHPGTVMELSEVVGVKRQIFDEIERQSREWDGSEPIRRVG